MYGSSLPVTSSVSYTAHRTWIKSTKGVVYPPRPDSTVVLGRDLLDRDLLAAVSAQRDGTLRLAHATPHAIGFCGLQRMIAAQLQHWACGTNSFRTVFPLGASASPLAVGVVEHIRIFSTASAMQLPFPKISVGPWKQMWL